MRQTSVISDASNKALLQHAFEETAKRNGRPFVEALADDVRWTIIGTTAWSGIDEGKRAVVAELLAPLAEQFTGANIISGERFVAEGDLVVVEGRNHRVYVSPDAELAVPEGSEPGFIVRYSIMRIAGIGPWVTSPAL